MITSMTLIKRMAKTRTNKSIDSQIEKYSNRIKTLENELEILKSAKFIYIEEKEKREIETKLLDIHFKNKS